MYNALISNMFRADTEFLLTSLVSSVMALSATGLYKGYDRAFCVRMKSTLTKRGCHFKSSGYRVTEFARNENKISSLLVFLSKDLKKTR